MIACEISVDTYWYVEDGIVHVDIDTTVKVEGRQIPVAGRLTTVPLPRHPPSEIKESEEEVSYGIITDEGVKVIDREGDALLLGEWVHNYWCNLREQDSRRPERDLGEAGGDEWTTNRHIRP